MFFVVASMVVVLLVAGAVVVFAAYPHRGQPVPYLPWLGTSMDRVADRFRTLRDGPEDEREDATVYHVRLADAFVQRDEDHQLQR